MENEMRLIDANEVKKRIWYGNSDPSSMRQYASGFIDNAPTVDAVEVVHANWDNNGICTLCGYPIPTDSKYDFIDKDDCLFCYHCGAKMDGGNEDG